MPIYRQAVWADIQIGFLGQYTDRHSRLIYRKVVYADIQTGRMV